MLEWLKSSFEGLFVVCAWIILLSFAICGAIIGYNLWEIIGGIIGIVLGLVLAIDFLGLIAIYILMAKKVEKIAECQSQLVALLKKTIVPETPKTETPRVETPREKTPKTIIELEDERKKKFEEFEF